MRFLADENFPGSAVTALSALGHDVIWVRIADPGISDRDVLARTIRESRILLTFDKDFGELARNAALPPHCGIILFRVPIPRPSELGAQIVTAINGRSDWAGSFSVIEPGRIRMRRFGQPA